MRRITKWQRQLVYTLLLLGVAFGAGHLAPFGTKGSDYAGRLAYPAVVAIESKESLCSGFFISTAGHVLSCAHGLVDGHGVTVVTANGQRFPADVVAADLQKDLAVLKVETTNPPLLRLGENHSAYYERIYLFGHRQGRAEWTEGQLITADLLVDGQRYMQIQGKAVPGYSGGPLLDGNGNVLGMVTQLIARTNLALAVPAGVLRDFLSDHRIAHSFVGDDFLPKGNTGRLWPPAPGNWADLSPTVKGVILLLPVAVTAALIFFLRWYQRRKKRLDEHDFEIEFPAGNGC